MFAAQNQAAFNFVFGELQCVVQKFFVINNAPRFQTARRCQNNFRARVVYARGEFFGAKAAEDDRMRRAQPRASEHGKNRFGSHAHINHGDIAPADSARGERAGEARGFFLQFGVGDDALDSGERAVVDNRRLFAVPVFNMAVNGVFASVKFAARKPAVKRRIGIVQHCAPLFAPQQPGGGFAPKPLRIIPRARKQPLIFGHARILTQRAAMPGFLL